MQVNELTLTRDPNGRPSKGRTMLYSTNQRLVRVINRSVIFSYVDAVYNNATPLFVKEIKEDILFELEALVNTEMTSKSAFEYVYPVGTPDLTDRMAIVIGLCKFLIGEQSLPPAGDPSKLLIGLPFGMYSNFFTAVVKYKVAQALVDNGEAAEAFTIQPIRVPVIHRSGFSLLLYQNENAIGSFEFDPAKYSDVKSNCQLLNFFSCVFIPNATVDVYFGYIANACFETDENMFDDRNKDLQSIRYMKWLRSLYTNNEIGRVVRDIVYGNDLVTKNADSAKVRMFLKTIVTLFDRFKMSLGRGTTEILNSCVASGVLSNQDLETANYIRGVLTNPAASETVTAEETKAYSESTELYVPSLDINSPLFVSFEQEEDEPPEEEPEEEPEEPEEEPPEEDPEEDPEEEPEVDPEEDPAEEPPEEPEEPVEDPVSTNDKSGITITLPVNPKSTDAYLYLLEVEFLITELLNDPPESISSEDLTILRVLKSHWLYLLSIETVHEIVTSIVDIPVKITK